MLKDSTYDQQYALLEECIPDIIRSIRRDLRVDHLKQDDGFLKKHFGKKSPNKLKTEDLVPVYSPYLKEGDEKIWEFFTERWLMKHGGIYDFFEAGLMTVAKDFTELEELDEEFSKRLASESVKHFGALDTYIFCVLNTVVFPESVYKELREAAHKDQE